MEIWGYQGSEFVHLRQSSNYYNRQQYGFVLAITVLTAGDVSVLPCFRIAVLIIALKPPAKLPIVPSGFPLIGIYLWFPCRCDRQENFSKKPFRNHDNNPDAF